MRVALLQIRLDAKSRARNIQAIIAGIGSAAQAEVAPDLIILPGACDTGGTAASKKHSNACLDCVRETIAGQAREWGVFIAAGLHRHIGKDRFSGVILFDPDGDVIAEDPATGTEAGKQLETWHCPVGRLGVAEPSALASESRRVDSTQDGALYAVPLATVAGSEQMHKAGVDPRALCEETAGRNGAYWAVVLAGNGDDAVQKTGGLMGSYVCDPTGNLLAHADTAGEMIVHAEVPLTSGVEDSRE
ncbi:MAG: hypothetical protein JSU63_13180 [Phycisphaerales bacterium]|nr:MAG: hypothetical protein JSU63_13180 [Phycisphaerales bacterium]